MYSSMIFEQIERKYRRKEERKNSPKNDSPSPCSPPSAPPTLHPAASVFAPPQTMTWQLWRHYFMTKYFIFQYFSSVYLSVILSCQLSGGLVNYLEYCRYPRHSYSQLLTHFSGLLSGHLSGNSKF